MYDRSCSRHTLIDKICRFYGNAKPADHGLALCRRHISAAFLIRLPVREVNYNYLHLIRAPRHVSAIGPDQVNALLFGGLQKLPLREKRGGYRLAACAGQTDLCGARHSSASKELSDASRNRTQGQIAPGIFHKRIAEVQAAKDEYRRTVE